MKSKWRKKAQYGRIMSKVEIRPSNPFLPFNQDEVELSIPQRFEYIANRHSDNLAVTDSYAQLTYSALNLSANRIAHALLDRCGSAREPVGLLLGKDAIAIAAVIAVLKAGKAYVPLDPSYPFDRLRSISEHVQLTSILTDADNAPLADQLSSSGIDVVRVDNPDHPQKTENPALQLTADAIAAIFYTSGSTGEPKGVMQSHRNILHRAMIDTNRFHICCQDRLSLLTSPSYSVSLRNLFSALLNGAAVCSFDIEKEGLNALAKWLSRSKITIYFSVPTVFRQMAENLAPGDDLSHVRLVDLGGEPVKKCDVDIYKQYFPANCIFVNSLASNEAGLYRNYFVDKETPIPTDVLPAGVAVRDKVVSLLDEHGNRVGAGQVGEITIRSRYLSPGYWRNPELTAKFFQPDDGDPLNRVYHTGDLGSFRPDGCLLYIGRKDFRTKIRGIRVELEEVESTIARHPSVQEAVVIDSKDDGAEDSRLIAYLVIKRGSILDSTDLRGFLKDKLPDFMVPSAFVFLATLPLTPNGKVDRRALLNHHPIVASKQPYVAPRNIVERQLATIWEADLKIQPIGIHDNFFELGGHSLLAVRLVGQIEKSLNKHLLPATVFRAPTIAQLAEIIARECEAPTSPLMPIHENGSRVPFFWIHGDQSNAFLSQYLGPHQPLYSLEHQSQDGRPARYDRVETIAAHYLREIQSIVSKEPYFIGGYSFGAIVAFELAQQLQQQGRDVGLLFLLDPPEPTSMGEASRLPVAQIRSTPADSRSSKVLDHWQRISGLGAREKLVYVCSRVIGLIASRISRLKSPFDKLVKGLLCKYYLALGFSLPASLRSFYILGIYGQALRRYRQKSYPGPAILVRTETRSAAYSRNWSRLIDGGVALYQVAGDHMMIRQEPYARHWAETLSACLAKAQARANRRANS